MLKTVGASLAALGGALGCYPRRKRSRKYPLVRQRVCDGLRWCGLEMHENSNRTLIDSEGRLSTEGAAIQALVIPVEEGLQIAHDCVEEITQLPLEFRANQQPLRRILAAKWVVDLGLTMKSFICQEIDFLSASESALAKRAPIFDY